MGPKAACGLLHVAVHNAACGRPQCSCHGVQVNFIIVVIIVQKIEMEYVVYYRVLQTYLIQLQKSIKHVAE